MDPEIKQAFAELARLFEDNSQSLQAEMELGFDRVEAATRRNSTTIAGGAKAIAGLSRWAGARDKTDAKRDRQIRDLHLRLQKVERALKRRAS